MYLPEVLIAGLVSIRLDSNGKHNHGFLVHQQPGEDPARCQPQNHIHISRLWVVPEEGAEQLGTPEKYNETY